MDSGVSKSKGVETAVRAVEGVGAVGDAKTVYGDSRSARYWTSAAAVYAVRAGVEPKMLCDGACACDNAEIADHWAGLLETLGGAASAWCCGV